jgi:hypothetical protein
MAEHFYLSDLGQNLSVRGNGLGKNETVDERAA